MDRGIVGSPHSRGTDSRTPAAKHGCETCHGAGSKHADDPSCQSGQDLSTKMAPREVSATCTTCHNRGEHALWDGSQHEARGLTCTTCHSVHDPKSREGQLKAAAQPQLCATCHRDKVAKLDRSGHMPVREGKMQCTTCHNTHGSTNVKLLRKGRLGRRDLHVVPRRQARAVPLGARAGPGRLRDLPRSARLVERAHAGREAADALPALPCRHAASQHDL